jgi:hypothetical protein
MPQRFYYPSTAAAICLAVVVTLPGCSGGKLGTVTGRVTKNGKPQPKVAVEFAPIAGGRHSTATTNDNGHYELIFTSEKNGALIGTHQVSIKTPEKINPDSMIVLAPATELLNVQREVESGSNTFDFELSDAAKTK